MEKTLTKRPLVLIILDGWGYREETEYNAIAAAKKPHFDHLFQTYPHTLLSGSGKCVGLPDGQMGNSEVGHLNMGAGRIVYQDLTRIDAAIEDGSFYQNPALTHAMALAKRSQKAVHLLGLLSPGGVHSHDRHWQAMLALAKQIGVPHLYLHPFLDGRDTPPKSAATSLSAIESALLPNWGIASLIGRFYAMDRDKRWDRVQKAYDLLTLKKADFTAPNAQSALDQAYARGETDEFMKATVIGTGACIEEGDVVIFMNFRADRARELTEAFVNPDFQGFHRHAHPTLGEWVSLTEYDSRWDTPLAFPPTLLTNILAAYLSERGFTQLRLAETEKYAHVTFFFNGGIEAPFPLEDRILIPSPKVATYDLQPEMSAPELTEHLTQAIRSKKYDVIICNFANPDMVGHTGNLKAATQAIEAIDACLGKIALTLQEVGGEALITADHGNAERMFDPCTKQPHTAHTNDPVPFIYIGRNADIVKNNGKLSDIAPTMLYLMGQPIPPEMTGQPLVALR